MHIQNIPEANPKKRLVIVGAGFAGLRLLRKVSHDGLQIVLLDRNNFHQFQPLLYQVATSGLEPSAISFPIRKILQKEKDIYFRMAELLEVHADRNEISTTVGRLTYDYLVIATGAHTNFFGQQAIERNAYSMKTASDAILIRNTMLENFELALQETDPEGISQYLNVVLVGGGPTGVELSGALAEMKRFIFPKDYPELDLSKMHIMLYEASGKLLSSMSEEASAKSKEYLEKLGVEVHLNTRVLDYDGNFLNTSDGKRFGSKTLIWVAGVQANHVKGLAKEVFGRGNRILVDKTNRVSGHENIFVLGDLALMQTDRYPQGHPQVAQVAIQQADRLAKNIKQQNNGTPLKPFEYCDKGSMATIGRNLAVADLPFTKLMGFAAWVLWSFVHLFTIMGVKNRLFIFLNWSWGYFTYDQSLRVLIRPRQPHVKQ